MPNPKRIAPAGNGSDSGASDATKTSPVYSEATDKLRADAVLRCAWLTVHAEYLRVVDPGGLLSSQLLDLRDLLESVDVGGEVG